MLSVRQLSNAMENATLIRIIGLIIVAIVVIGIIGFISNKLTLRRRQCAGLSEIYKDFPKISSINFLDNRYQYTLKDYYIKTAYNACSIGDFKNNFVDVCALKDCIRQGYRCLDFEIYSIDNEPVIAASSVNSYNVKQTYNSIPFGEVCKIIASHGFSGGTCPNPNDPLIIHLRIMSQNTVIYKKMAEQIYDHLTNYVLGKQYSYENRGRNLGDVKLTDLKGKIIISVDRANPMYEGTDLEEYVNIASNSIFMQALRFDEVKYAPDMQELIEYNKKQMSIVMPNLGVDDSNPSAALAMKYGCQMIGMCMQNYDTNLKFYDQTFNDAGCAFILKPDNLRYIPLTINVPNAPPKAYSYAKRDISSDYYNFTI